MEVKVPATGVRSQLTEACVSVVPATERTRVGAYGVGTVCDTGKYQARLAGK